MAPLSGRSGWCCLSVDGSRAPGVGRPGPSRSAIAARHLGRDGRHTSRFWTRDNPCSNTDVGNCGAASFYLSNASYSSNGVEQYMIQVDMGYGLTSGNWAYATNWSWNDSTTDSSNSGYESFSPTPDWSLTDFQKVSGPGEYYFTAAYIAELTFYSLYYPTCTSEGLQESIYLPPA
jgi:hypothetical protein